MTRSKNGPERKHLVGCRMTPTEYEELVKATERSGLSNSDYIRLAIRNQHRLNRLEVTQADVANAIK